MWKGTKPSNLRRTITNMELHDLKSGAPHVELCGYIIELWYSAILGFCPHIKTKQNIFSHDFHFLPLFLAVLVIDREGAASAKQRLPKLSKKYQGVVRRS